VDFQGILHRSLRRREPAAMRRAPKHEKRHTGETRPIRREN
jgi:hypothetical protein